MKSRQNSKRKDGRYQKQFTVNRKRYTVYGKTKRELAEREKAKREQIAAGIERRINPTVAEYIDRWIDRKSVVKRASTVKNYTNALKGCMRQEIADANCSFGELKLAEVTAADVYEVRAGLQAEGMSTCTVNDYMHRLSSVFITAKKERTIDYNPCETVETLPRTEPKVSETTHRPLTDQEIIRFFADEELQTTVYYNALRLAERIGIRVGEVGAIEYRDIRDGRLHIERTITRTTANGYEIGEKTKTAAGDRYFDLTPELNEIITAQKRLNLDLYGNIISPEQPLFRGPRGGLLLDTTINGAIKRACRRQGIEPFSFHAFRHTFGMRLAADPTIPPITAQYLLGHDHLKTTFDVYYHTRPEDVKTALEKVTQPRGVAVK